MCAKLGRYERCMGLPLIIVVSSWIVLSLVHPVVQGMHLQYFVLACAGILFQAAPSRRRQHGSYFARHWRGDLPLTRSFWLNGAVVLALGVLSSFVAARTVTVALFRENHGFLVVVALGETFLQVAAYAWALVGIWRAAGEYRGPRVWGILARLGMALGVLISALRLVGDLGALSSV